MAGDLYLKSYNFGFSWVEGKQTSAGATDAGKLIALNASGLINLSLLDFSSPTIPTNLGFGLSALTLNTGARNTAFGYQSLTAAAAFNDNVGVGYRALNVATGSSNVGVGSDAGLVNAGGANNTFLGYRAGLANTSGNANTFIGSQAGLNCATGSINVVIGYLNLLGSNADNNSIVIGSSVVGLGSNTVVIGNNDVVRTSLKGIVQGVGYTVATLPAPVAGIYARAFVTDSNATMTAGVGAVVAGGGANLVPVYTMGADWRIG